MKVMNSEVRDQTVLEGEGVPATGLGQPSPDWSRNLRALLIKRRSWPRRFLPSARGLIDRARWYREDKKAADELERRLRQLNAGSQRETPRPIQPEAIPQDPRRSLLR